MKALFATSALLGSGWARNVRFEVENGSISSISVDQTPHPGDARAEIIVPGMANLHSHAFQRGMAGLAEVRGPGTDSFWSWREEMYRFALTMLPDQLQAVASMLYVEMLEEGFTRVGEFHYLHHSPDGSPYVDIGEHAVSIAGACDVTGIHLTMLPVYYAYAGFGKRAPQADQRRFINDIDQFERLFQRTGDIIKSNTNAILGVAPHSLRAVGLDEIERVVGLSDGPVHIHVAEQTKEVDDCIAFSGKRPIDLLYDTVPVEGRWCLIHATHMTDGEVSRMARSGAVAGLCPITEANLGDGTFRATEFIEAGGAFGVGSDSNVLIGLGDELRQLEYSQRLRDRTRNAIAAPGASTGRMLFEYAARGGAQALGGRGGVLDVGRAADFVSLAADHPALVARAGDSILDSWIFAGRNCVESVWVGGRRVVSHGRHSGREAIEKQFKTALRQLRGLA